MSSSSPPLSSSPSDRADPSDGGGRAGGSESKKIEATQSFDNVARTAEIVISGDGSYLHGHCFMNAVLNKNRVYAQLNLRVAIGSVGFARAASDACWNPLCATRSTPLAANASLRCTKCRVAVYCTRECQKTHWRLPSHHDAATARILAAAVADGTMRPHRSECNAHVAHYWEFGEPGRTRVAEFVATKKTGGLGMYVHAWLVDDAAGGRVYDWVDSWPTVAAARSCRIDFKDGDVIRGLAPDELERRGLRYVEADLNVQAQVYREWSSTARIGVVPGDDASEDAECNAVLNHIIRHSGPALKSASPTPAPTSQPFASSSSSSPSSSSSSSKVVVAAASNR